MAPFAASPSCRTPSSAPTPPAAELQLRETSPVAGWRTSSECSLSWRTLRSITSRKLVLKVLAFELFGFRVQSSTGGLRLQVSPTVGKHSSVCYEPRHSSNRCNALFAPYPAREQRRVQAGTRFDTLPKPRQCDIPDSPHPQQSKL